VCKRGAYCARVPKIDLIIVIYTMLIFELYSHFLNRDYVRIYDMSTCHILIHLCKTEQNTVIRLNKYIDMSDRDPFYI
jgi:hypothetical protein